MAAERGGIKAEAALDTKKIVGEPMDLRKLKTLIDLVSESNISELEITALRPQRTTGLVVMAARIHNQRGELVLEGEHTYLLRKSAG